MSRRRVVYLGVVLSVLAGCFLSPESSNPFDENAGDETQARGSVSGTVTADDGTALSGVNVALLNDSIISGGFSTVSGANGTFRVPDVLRGTYTITFTKADYTDTSFTLSFVIGEHKTLPAPVRMRFAPSVSRDVNGSLLGAVDGIDSVVAVLSGDGIEPSAPLVTRLSWLPVSKRFTGAIRTPQNGLVWNIQVKVYKQGLITGYATLPFDIGAANVVVPDFDADNAVPTVRITAPLAQEVFWSASQQVQFTVTAQDSFGGTIRALRWDFAGNGAWDSELDAPGPVTHTFAAGTGWHRALVEVEDNDGNRAVDSVQFFVGRAIGLTGLPHRFILFENGTLYSSVRQRFFNGFVKVHGALAIDSAGQVWQFPVSSGSSGHNGQGITVIGGTTGEQSTEPKVIAQQAQDIFSSASGDDPNAFITLILKQDGSLWHAGGAINNLTAANATLTSVRTDVARIKGLRTGEYSVVNVVVVSTDSSRILCGSIPMFPTHDLYAWSSRVPRALAWKVSDMFEYLQVADTVFYWYNDMIFGGGNPIGKTLSAVLTGVRDVEDLIIKNDGTLWNWAEAPQMQYNAQQGEAVAAIYDWSVTSQGTIIIRRQTTWEVMRILGSYESVTSGGNTGGR